MKVLLEIIVAVLLHPIAFILVLVNLASRSDLTSAQKLIWGLVSILWGIGPILYVLVGDGTLW